MDNNSKLEVPENTAWLVLMSIFLILGGFGLIAFSGYEVFAKGVAPRHHYVLMILSVAAIVLGAAVVSRKV